MPRRGGTVDGQYEMKELEEIGGFLASQPPFSHQGSSRCLVSARTRSLFATRSCDRIFCGLLDDSDI